MKSRKDTINDQHFDELEIRCPKLGHEVRFAYCRLEAVDLPCSRAISCWQSRVPVEDALRTSMNEEEWTRFRSNQPKDRLSTILDVMTAAGRRKKT
ncbi:MAG: hypothetical protein ABSB79_08625 [Syntrophales bacterium]